MYFLSSLDAINLTYTVIDTAEKIPEIRRVYDHSMTVSRPAVAIMTRDVLRGAA
jgi:sulfopyruvate decarboxylase TPP-binding subunit